jgi:hypothetical protein
VALYGALVAGVAAVQVPVTAGTAVLISRPSGTLGTIYVGTDNAVTTATGVPCGPGQAIGLSGRPSGGGPGSGVWVISDTPATDVRWIAGTF